MASVFDFSIGEPAVGFAPGAVPVAVTLVPARPYSARAPPFSAG
jgi:hypothetical protein